MTILWRSRWMRLLLLLVAIMLPAPTEARDLQACFSQCSVMEVGCAAVGGELYGSCSYYPGLPENARCQLPGCYCPSEPDGLCWPLIEG